MSALTVGLDIGTTGTKAVIFEPGRGVLAEAQRPVVLHSPHPGWAEADTAQWWGNVCAVVPEALATAGVAACDVAAVACSGMVPAVVAVDTDGRALRRAVLQNDARTAEEIAQLAKALDGLDLVARTGSALTQQSVAPTLMWLAHHEPDVWTSTARVVGSYDWLGMALGAGAHVERNWAIESGLWDLDGTPLRAVLDAASVAPSLLPPVRRSGDVVGAVSAAAAAATGLREGTPVVVGGADHVLSAYAAGLADPGDWLIKLGGAGDVLVVTNHPFVDARLYLDEHPRNGLWLPNGCMATSGSLIRWWQSISGAAPIETLEAEAATSRPAEVLCLPYFLGEKSPLHDPDLRGAFFGLHLGHTRGDLYRSVLEAIAFGFRHHVEVFEMRGVVLGAARVTNGGSRSPVWKQILADALGVPLLPILEHPGASLGAAVAAAVGVGLIESWEEGAASVETGKAVEPDLRLTDRYDEAYGLWREFGASTTSLAHRLAARDRLAEQNRLAERDRPAEEVQRG